MDQSKPSTPAWVHERWASTLVVGVITNEFHKVLVYIYVQDAYAWKWEENAAHKQGDTSSIQNNTFSTNQARSRGSMGPQELANRHKIGALTHNWYGDPRDSLLDKFGAGWSQKPVGQPPRSPDRVLAPPNFIFHVEFPHWMPMLIQKGPGSNSR